MHYEKFTKGGEVFVQACVIKIIFENFITAVVSTSIDVKTDTFSDDLLGYVSVWTC
jgi:hypothetical protein